MSEKVDLALYSVFQEKKLYQAQIQFYSQKKKITSVLVLVSLQFEIDRVV